MQLSEWAADVFFQMGEQAIRKRGCFYVMLSGGETPRGMYEVLAMNAKRTVKARIALTGGGFSLTSVPFWSRVKIFWTNDPQPVTTRKDTTSVLMNTLIRPLNHCGARLEKNTHYFILAGNSEDAAAEADRYERLLRAELEPVGGRPDLILAGAGSDGQIFGITPNAEIPEGRWMAVLTTAKGPWLTMTPEMMVRARALLLIMAGRKKQIPLVSLLSERGEEQDMPVRLVRRLRERVALLVDREALTWPTFEVVRRDGTRVFGDYREGMDPGGPIGIGIHGFMGAGSMANLVIALYRRSWRTDREVVDGSFVALHRGGGGRKRLYGYLPGARWWFRPELALVRDFADGLEAAVAKIVADEVRQFGAQSRFIYVVGHSSANQIVKYAYARLDDYPNVRDYVKALVLCNPFSTRRPGLYHPGVRLMDGLLANASPAMRSFLEGIRARLTHEQAPLRDAVFAAVVGLVFGVLTNPVVTSAIRMERGRWKNFVGSTFLLPAIEEAGLPLEFYPAVAEAYKRIPPDAFLREVHALLKLDPRMEERAEARIGRQVARGKLRVLVVADQDDPLVAYKTTRAAAAAMGAQLVELRMRDHMHRLRNRTLRCLGPHMTHMFHPQFLSVVEAFLRGRLEVDRDDPCTWRIN